MIKTIFIYKTEKTTFWAIERHGVIAMVRKEAHSAMDDPISCNERLIGELCETLIPLLNPPNVRDHRAGPNDIAKQKGSLWPAPVHRLVGQLFS